MAVELLGYSERGMVNALCNDIRYSGDSIARLETFLSWCRFPLTHLGPHPLPEPNFTGIKEAILIVEQSFSDYGDLDLLILITDEDGRKRAILAEAKVATDTGCPRTIEGQWDDFLLYLDGYKKKTSSLFVQLYRKVRLVEQVANPNRVFAADVISRRWSLGNNQVVRKAAKFLSEYKDDPWFLAIVPDPAEDVGQFFNVVLADPGPEAGRLPNWDVQRWGYVSWRRILDEIKRIKDQGPEPDRWRQLEINFEWNGNQVYPVHPAPVVQQAGAVLARGFRSYKGEVIYVSWIGAIRSRVVPAEQQGDYFPRSFLVPTANLVGAQEVEPPLDPAGLLPIARNIYRWEPPVGDNPQPPTRATVPAPPQSVIVLTPSWETSAVRMVNEKKEPYGDRFHVYTHHLLRNNPDMGHAPAT